MNFDVVYSSEYIKITRLSDVFYIESYKNGMSIEQFNKLMMSYPQVIITSFIAVKNALLFAPRPPVMFGEIKKRVSVEVSDDQLKAYISLYLLESELSPESRSNLVREIISELNHAGVTFGIKSDILMGELRNGEPILIAEGIPPVHGDDSEIRMYQLNEAKPDITEDGKADHYHLNLINKAKIGDWLGERTDPTKGTEGTSVRGAPLHPMPGKIYPLKYDRKSVREVSKNGITTLYATIDGAVFYEGDRIGISNYLEIEGNIDFRTGNVDFDGFLTIKGSVEDGFTVYASKDVEILGDYGIGSVKEIASRDGSIYIKGGIAGKNKAVIKSSKNVYTKYISDATIICGGSVHIGFYCLNSNITAKEVIIDSTNGRIIGGTINAEIKIVSSIVGSSSEKRTSLSVKGFDPADLKNKLESLTVNAEELKKHINRLKQDISVLNSTPALSEKQVSELENRTNLLYKYKNTLKTMEDDSKALTIYLKTRGEGEIAALKRIYPNTVIEIKGIVKEIERVTENTTFFVQAGELKEI